MKTLLSLDSLEVIDAIDRKGSFAAAAATLNRVPSAISYSIQKMEQDLGITLFHKQGRKSVMTAAGRLVLEQGRQILKASQEMADAAQQVATGWEPRLRIGIDTVIPTDLLLPLIEEFYALNPKIDIELSEEVLGGSWEALIDDRVDLLVGAPESPPSHQGIRSIDWQSMETIFVASPDHPLCQHPQPIGMDLISQHRAIVVRDSSRHQAPLSRGIFNRESFLLVPDMEKKIQAHLLGLGVGFAPLFRVRDHLANGRLIALDITEPLAPASLSLAWKISNRGKGVNWFVEKLKKIQLK
jgi:DNA-binding transcriptional LysR family regulator